MEGRGRLGDNETAKSRRERDSMMLAVLGGWYQWKGCVFIFFASGLHACMYALFAVWARVYTSFCMFVNKQARAGACECKGPSIILDCSSTLLVEAGPSIPQSSPGLPVWLISVVSLPWGLKGESYLKGNRCRLRILTSLSTSVQVWSWTRGLASDYPSSHGLSSLRKHLTLVTCIDFCIISFWSSFMSSFNPKKTYTSASETTLL